MAYKYIPRHEHALHFEHGHFVIKRVKLINNVLYSFLKGRRMPLKNMCLYNVNVYGPVVCNRFRNI